MEQVTDKKAGTEKKPLKPAVREAASYAAMLAAGFLNAVGVHAFISPNGFINGGVAGLSIILQHLTSLNAGIFLISINAPLLVLAFFYRGRMFAVKTLITVGSMSGFLLLLDAVKFPVYIAENKLLPAAAGGVLSGFCLAVILKCGSSTGGTDIIATFIHKKRSGTNIAWFIFALDMVSVVISVFIFKTPEGKLSIEPLILALSFMFVSAKVCETILEGFKSALKFEIVTTAPEAISQEIMETLRRGVTLLHGTGMYSKTDRAVLICVIRRRQIAQLQNIVKKHPDTFCYISSTSDVMGKF